MPKFTKVKSRKGQAIGETPGGSPGRFKSRKRLKTTTYKKVKRIKPSYPTHKNRNFRGD